MSSSDLADRLKSLSKKSLSQWVEAVATASQAASYRFEFLSPWLGRKMTQIAIQTGSGPGERLGLEVCQTTDLETVVKLNHPWPDLLPRHYLTAASLINGFESAAEIFWTRHLDPRRYQQFFTRFDLQMQGRVRSGAVVRYIVAPQVREELLAELRKSGEVRFQVEARAFDSGKRNSSERPSGQEKIVATCDVDIKIVELRLLARSKDPVR